jgi:hypothetical protein
MQASRADEIYIPLKYHPINPILDTFSTISSDIHISITNGPTHPPTMRFTLNPCVLAVAFLAFLPLSTASDFYYHRTNNCGGPSGHDGGIGNVPCTRRNAEADTIATEIYDISLTGCICTLYQGTNCEIDNDDLDFEAFDEGQFLLFQFLEGSGANLFGR